MLAKVLVLVIGVGLTAGVLLATRQARLQAAHDLAGLRLLITREEHRLYDLRARIAALATPESVRRMAAKVSPLRQIEPGVRTALETGQVREGSAPPPLALTPGAGGNP